MSAVCTSFLSFCTAGVYQWGVEGSCESLSRPQLNEMAAMFHGRGGRKGVERDSLSGWMVPALSPVRWLWGYYITAEVAR